MGMKNQLIVKKYTQRKLDQVGCAHTDGGFYYATRKFNTFGQPGQVAQQESSLMFRAVVILEEKAESESFCTHWSIIHKRSNLDQRKGFSFLWDSPEEGFTTLIVLRHWGCWHDHTHVNNTDFLRNSPTLHTSLNFVFTLSRRRILMHTSRKDQVPENTEEERAEKS